MMLGLRPRGASEVVSATRTAGCAALAGEGLGEGDRRGAGAAAASAQGASRAASAVPAGGGRVESSTRVEG
jgi:hypothetical protein